MKEVAKDLRRAIALLDEVDDILNHIPEDKTKAWDLLIEQVLSETGCNLPILRGKLRRAEIYAAKDE